MASGLTPLGWTTKWVIAPLAMLAIGVFAVGPNLGKVKSKPDASAPAPAESHPKAGPSATASQPSSAGPDMDVSVLPIAAPVAHHASHHRHHSTPDASTDKPAEPNPKKPDDGAADPAPSTSPGDITVDKGE